MYRPTATPPTPPAPTRLVRRAVLGTAFLLGLAFALAPRTPAVHAQESKTAPAAASKPQAATKTLTISDGRVTISDGRGGKVKIEAGGSTDPEVAIDAGGDPNAEDVSPADAGKPGSRGPNISIGKHGRVKVNGLGSDREFDSFGQFVHNEPALAGMVVGIVSVVFLSPVLAIGLILWYRMRKARMLNETMLKLAEKGIVPPAEALYALAGGRQAEVLSTAASTAPIYEQAKLVRRRAAWSDLRKGVFTGGVGLALIFYSMLEDREANAIGLVLLFVGIGFVVLWWFEERQIAPSGGSASGGAPGGQPPSA